MAAPMSEKAIELPLAVYFDAVLSKKRILEVYLNIAEWAPGVYGAEAGCAFIISGVGVNELTPRQAALMAVTLPNPATRNPANPTANLNQVANTDRAAGARCLADMSGASGKIGARALAKRCRDVYSHAKFHVFRPFRVALRPRAAAVIDDWSCKMAVPKKKDLAVQARHAPFRRRAEGPDLCRGQEFRRDASPASHRPEDRHVSRPPGSGAQGELIAGFLLRIS